MNHDEMTRRPLPLPPLRLEESYGSDGTLVLTLEGELDIASSDVVRRRLHELQLSETPTTLDLSGLNFVDCSGLRVIFEAIELADHDCSWLEVSPDYPAALRRLLELIPAEVADARMPRSER